MSEGAALSGTTAPLVGLARAACSSDRPRCSTASSTRTSPSTTAPSSGNCSPASTRWSPAFAAGRVLAARLAAELPDVTAGIGISAGDAVAGNVGDVRRYEYTVIGDPVNEAARLTELAKTVPGRVLAAADAVAMAVEDEAARWELGDATVLRGRSAPTRLATPKGHASPERDESAAAAAR